MMTSNSICTSVLLVMLAAGAAQATELKNQPPASEQKAGPRPSEIVKGLAAHPAPALNGAGDEARKNALAFIDWASASTRGQDEQLRRILADARDNRDIVAAFCNEAGASSDSDHDRALIVLGLLGEMRSDYGLECLAQFIARPLPEKGTLVDGEILEQTALASLQAKAVDGLAYLNSDKANRIVLDTVAKHPSRIVRAEAIAAYLWNQKYAADAKRQLKAVVRPEEAIYLDRIVRENGEKADTFNRKLALYLRAHPEVRPPAPQKGKPERAPKTTNPPRF